MTRHEVDTILGRRLSLKGPLHRAMAASHFSAFIGGVCFSAMFAYIRVGDVEWAASGAAMVVINVALAWAWSREVSP